MKLLVIGPVTRAMRAQELLRRHGISSGIRRIENSAEGCVRALLVEEEKAGRAVSLLAAGGLAVRRVEEEGK